MMSEEIVPRTTETEEASSVMTVGETDFDANVLQADLPVLVDFWAEWCVPCHLISPAVEAIAREYHGRILAAKVNVDENPNVTFKLGVMSIPTLLLFKDGKEQARIQGARGKDAIVREIEPYLSA
jgi:thioredoxin 1